MVRALIFDFDGLILDTESPVYESWRAVYEEHGVSLPRDRWCGSIGGSGRDFDPLDHLKELMGGDVAEEEVQARRRRHRDGLLARLAPMPGVVEHLRAARAMGLGIAVASSSPRDWVEGHLHRLGLLEAFDRIVTEDDVSRVKPHPELYLRATADLGVDPAGAIALEDSPNGVTAARAAGVYCVAVPGPMTRDLDFDGADLVLKSLDARPLADLVHLRRG